MEVLLISKRGSDRSSANVAEVRFALERRDQIGGLPHREVVAHYEGAAALAARCRAQRISVVYLGVELGSEITAIRKALEGVDVLTVSAVSSYVPEGAVLGFDLVSGKPKIWVNLTQAKKQKVDFKSDALRVMKVYR